MSAIAGKFAKKYVENTVKAYEPTDPYYEFIVDHKGRQKRVKRDVPPGLTKKEEKILRKIRKRAHYLDKGMNLCGFRVGWTFFIGFIPIVGDATDAVLNYTLVVKPARKLDLPNDLTARMLFNNAVSAGVGLVPVVGDIALAAWKANWRNAHLLEDFLRARGEANLRAGGSSGLSELTEPTAADVLAAGGPSTPLHSAAAPMGAGGSGRATPVGPADGNGHKKSGKSGWFSFGSKAATDAQQREAADQIVANQQPMTQNAQRPL